MAAGKFLLLLDDIAVLMDDVAVMTKIAAKKSAGVLGDDLALNAQQVAGVVSDRELPVVWAVAKGSALNKAILVPAALLISAVVPAAIKFLLLLGGAFLCYEGFEKVFHKLAHRDARPPQERAQNLAKTPEQVQDYEKEKIKGAIRTDFILSAEVVVIALGSFADKPLLSQIVALVFFAAMMTIVVYGLVALIVKLDDIGLRLAQGQGAQKVIGEGIVRGAPYFMKTLGIVGTAAMFLVGGGILIHIIPPVEAAILAWSKTIPGLGLLIPTLINGVTGVVAGGLIMGVVTLLSKMIKRGPTPAPDAAPDAASPRGEAASSGHD